MAQIEFPLTGKVAIVTGASAPNGIGRAIVMRLARDGATVVATDIGGLVELDGEAFQREELLAQLVRDVEAQGGQSMTMLVDVTQESDISNCVQTVLSRYGRIDILVNNAGSVVGTGDFLASTPDQWDQSYRVNIAGPMMFCQAVIPTMQAQNGGRIVNIGSTGSLGAQAGFGAYTVMKHGLIGLSNTIAAEFGVNNILCNTVCPGFIATDMHMGTNKRLAAAAGLSVEAIKEQRYQEVALRRAGQPSEVADTVAFLAGPQGAYITGASLPVSGGVPCGI